MADEFEPAVRDVLADHPRLSVAQVGEIVEWPGSRRTLSDLVRRIRPLMLEREVEHLNLPRVGRARIGSMTVGRLSAGVMTFGRIRGNREADLPGT